MRRTAALAITLLAVPVLTSCSPARTSVIGVGLDTAGRLVAAVHVCSDEIEQAILTTEGDDLPILGSWERASPLTGTETWVLTVAGSTRWASVGPPVTELRHDLSYLLGAWNADSTASTGYLPFRAADVDRLEPGQVLVQLPQDAGAEPALTVVPLSELSGLACVT